MKKYILLLLFWGVVRSGWSQGNPADIPSLMAQLALSKPDTQRISIFIRLAASYVVPGRAADRMDSAALYLQKARELNKVFQIPVLRDRIDLISAYRHCLLFSSEDPRKVILPIIDTCQKTGDKTTETHAWMYLGSTIDEDKKSNVYKLSCFQNGLTLARQSGDDFTAFRLEGLIAHTHVLQNKFEEAERELSGMLQEEKKAGLVIPMYTHGELTFLYLSKGELNKALRYALETQRMMGIAGDSTSADEFYHQIISIYGALGKFTERGQWGKRDLEFKLATNNIPGVYSNIESICDLMRYEGDPRAVLGFIRKKLARQPPTGVNDQLKVQQVLGDAYLYEKNYALAEKCYLEMIRLGNLQTHNYSLFDRAFGDYKIGRFYYEIGLYRKARPFLERSTKEYEEYGVLPYTRFNNELLFRIDSALDDYHAAFRHLKEFDRIGDSIFRADRNRQIEELQVAYQTEQKDKSIRLLEGKEQLARLQLRHSQSMQNWIIAAAAMLLIIVALLYRQTQIRKRNSLFVVVKNMQLQELVEEKDWLVKEIHHRVKNNLQTVTGLLKVQAGYLTSQEAITAINDSRLRIQSMTLIHQRLYQSNNLSEIKLPDYINELIDHLKESFDSRKKINILINIAPVEMDLAYCIPLGLILNEAITNAFKYAFPHRREGTIFIKLKNSGENKIQLTIQDDGIGLPPDFDARRSDSMGMTLMRGFCDQIGGQFAISGNNGTCIDVEFVYDREMTVPLQDH